MKNSLRSSLPPRLLLAASLCGTALALPATSHAGTSSALQQAAGPVQGRVVDEKGTALPGVNVIVKGTSNGSQTDADGRYTIKAPADAVLVFSFVGSAAQEVAVGGRTSIDITLKPDNKALDEIVVVGYGTQKKVNLTGAVGTVNAPALTNRPITNAGALLQGQVPGVYALQNSGKPGGDDATINIRGVGTLNNANPLVLIDGFPAASINDVNPQDIETISVLKDAASSAIYGNRAANGVILITTKRGSSQKMKLSYAGYYGVQQATRLPSVLNSVQYAELYNEAALNAGQQPRYTAAEIQKFRDGTDPLYPNINYFDVYYGKAAMQNHNLSLTGGSEDLRYALMANGLNQDGILLATQFKRINLRSNVDAFFLKDKRLRLSARIAGNRSERQEPTDEWNVKWQATTAPVWPLQNQNGEYVAVNGERNFYGETVNGSKANVLRHQFNGQVEAELKIVKGLSAELVYGYNWIQTSTNRFHANIQLAKLGGGYNKLASDLSAGGDQYRQTLLNGLLRYQKDLGKHSFNVLAGYSEEAFRWDWSNAYRRNFINNTQQQLNLGDAATQANNGGAYDLGLKSVFGRIGYIYDERYLFEANIRRDGSSRFARGKQWGTFPSFSAGWRLSQESFLRDVSWLSELKLRGSWGRLGNQNIGDSNVYPAISVLSSGQNYTLGGALMPGVATTALANPDISWETTTQTNVGVDLALRNGFSFTADYFSKRTSGILMQVPIPITLGDLSAPYQNVGVVDNKGFELSGTYRKAFPNGHFSTTLNASHIVNRVVDLNGRSPIINGPKALVEGAAVNSFYGYQQDGLYQTSDFNWQNNNDPSVPVAQRVYVLRDGVTKVANFTPQPGDLKFRDQNGDGIVTMDKDRTVLGKQFPDLTYAAQFSADWKGFDVSMFWQGVQGVQGYGYQELYSPFSNFSNNGSWWLDRWTPQTGGNTVPRLVLDETRTNIYSSYYMEDASYLRLKNLEVGYTLPTALIGKAGLGTVRVYASVQNAFTFTKFKGFDPEQQTSDVRAQAYPQTRVMIVGLNASF